MSSNTIAPVCKSCQKGSSSKYRNKSGSKHRQPEEDYYTKYYGKQREKIYSSRNSKKQNYNQREKDYSSRNSKNQNYNDIDNSNVSNNSDDPNQHVCMSCGKN